MTKDETMPSPSALDPFTIETIRDRLIVAAEESFIAVCQDERDELWSAQQAQDLWS